MPRRRPDNAHRPWKKGESGNPNGRPPKTEEMRTAEALARDHTEAAIKTLADMMNNKKTPPNVRAKCAEILTARGWGNPKNTTDIKVSHTPREMTTSELYAALSQANPDGTTETVDSKGQSKGLH